MLCAICTQVGREKISEGIKCLQDLVQWCNVITEKGGKPDEIIAYVQSLQPQVEVATTNMFNRLQFFY